MTYLIIWISVLIGHVAYDLVVKREILPESAHAILWSGFALLMHRIQFG